MPGENKGKLILSMLAIEHAWIPWRKISTTGNPEIREIRFATSLLIRYSGRITLFIPLRSPSSILQPPASGSSSVSVSASRLCPRLRPVWQRRGYHPMFNWSPISVDYHRIEMNYRWQTPPLFRPHSGQPNATRNSIRNSIRRHPLLWRSNQIQWTN